MVHLSRPGLLSDQVAVMFTIVNIWPPDSTPRPKRWLLEQTIWEKYNHELLNRIAEMEWDGDLHVNKQQRVAIVLQAADFVIPKSTGSASNRPYWKNNQGVRLTRLDYSAELNKYRRNPTLE